MFILEYEMNDHARYKNDPSKNFPLHVAINVIHSKYGTEQFDSYDIERVYHHWVYRRRNNGKYEKALMREYQEPPDTNDEDANVAFRTRAGNLLCLLLTCFISIAIYSIPYLYNVFDWLSGNERTVATRRQTQKKKNDFNGYIQMRQMYENMIHLERLLKHLKMIELLKKRLILSKIRWQDDRIDNQYFTKWIRHIVDSNGNDQLKYGLSEMDLQYAYSCFRNLYSPQLFQLSDRNWLHLTGKLKQQSDISNECPNMFFIAKSQFKDYQKIIEEWQLPSKEFRQVWVDLACNITGASKITEILKLLHKNQDIKPLKMPVDNALLSKDQWFGNMCAFEQNNSLDSETEQNLMLDCLNDDPFEWEWNFSDSTVSTMEISKVNESNDEWLERVELRRDTLEFTERYENALFSHPSVVYRHLNHKNSNSTNGNNEIDNLKNHFSSDEDLRPVITPHLTADGHLQVHIYQPYYKTSDSVIYEPSARVHQAYSNHHKQFFLQLQKNANSHFHHSGSIPSNVSANKGDGSQTNETN
ncbi:hypothetical protein RFI_03908 [Reticulomyxa filosa]|uniref:Uncharacterized protein n=1 Tax=Reticulomyxa filosa TaxID=46433 RepID=X6P6F6_RETFI|nr:hypothetical protein RFI_03908 [Reticulomyxa filosa]|eukprot:ETO33202.1 hypothetical protein RFI_03908 [Reticulomyxa filosa]